MTVVMLAAGTSSRMGERNKMLLPYKGMPMVAHCCMQALFFLENHGFQNTLVVATGYMKDEVEKALEHCMEYARNSKTGVRLTLVHNADYLEGQYSTTVCAVKDVPKGDAFFISLADMPFISPANYEALVPLLKDHDAVRPFIATGTNNGAGSKQKVPGHPVLLSPKMKKAIEENPNIGSVNRLLKDYDVHEVLFKDTSWTFDVDNPQTYETLSM